MFTKAQVLAGINYLTSFRPCDIPVGGPPMDLAVFAYHCKVSLRGIRSPEWWHRVGAQINTLAISLEYPQVIYDKPQLKSLV